MTAALTKQYDKLNPRQQKQALYGAVAGVVLAWATLISILGLMLHSDGVAIERVILICSVIGLGWWAIVLTVVQSRLKEEKQARQRGK